MFNRAYFIISNKNDLTKENARIKEVLKENGYQKNIISKIFKRITNNLFQITQLVSVTTINAIYKCPRGCDENKYKLIR